DLRCWRLVSKRCVRPDRVVVAPPALDDDLGLAESVEDFAVEQLVAQARVDLADCAPPCSGPARPEHRPAATSRRSLQTCIASLPLQSSLMSKTYLKSDHFNGGESPRCSPRL